MSPSRTGGEVVKEAYTVLFQWSGRATGCYESYGGMMGSVTSGKVDKLRPEVVIVVAVASSHSDTPTVVCVGLCRVLCALLIGQLD